MTTELVITLFNFWFSVYVSVSIYMIIDSLARMSKDVTRNHGEQSNNGSKQTKYLDDMPTVVMEHIVKRCDFDSILSLRKVSHSLRSFMIDINPDLHLFYIRIWVSNKAIKVELNGKRDPDYPARSIKYRHVSGGGCYVVSKKKTRFLKDFNYLKHASKDIKFIMARQQSTLNQFSVENMERDNLVFNELMRLLTENHKPGDKLLPVCSFIATTVPAVNVQSIMSIFTPGILRSIQICVRNFREVRDEKLFLDLSEVVESEVWKKAAACFIIGFRIDTTIRNFLHFKLFRVAIPTLSLEEAHALRAMTAESNAFIRCSLRLDSFPEKTQFLEFLNQMEDTLELFFEDHHERFYNEVRIIHVYLYLSFVRRHYGVQVMDADNLEF